jgi:hypothetical protein
MESVRKNPAVDLLPGHDGTPTMTEDELSEQALREEGVFPGEEGLREHIREEREGA